MTSADLIDYIVRTHHQYVKDTMPRIRFYLTKVAAKHQAIFPNGNKVLELFAQIQDDMTGHIEYEESTFFPQIKDLELNGLASKSSDVVNELVASLEKDHEGAGEIMYSIRALTDTYTPPAGACQTFRLCLTELREFENDLHAHVHLENHILFPRVQALSAGGACSCSLEESGSN
jgi:regulator of cell morphogenesis and NO signaling